MIPQGNTLSPPQTDKTTFITNFYDRCDEVLNVLVQEALQKMYGDNMPDEISFTKTFPDEHNAIVFANGKPVAGIYQNFNQSKWILYGYN